MRELYEYIDYRAYIADYLEEKRSVNRSYSLRLLARQVEMNASNILKVLQGQRELSKAGIEKFNALFKFKYREREYFKTMVLFSKSKSEANSKKLFEQLTEIAELPATTVEVDQYEFYKRWYNTALLALLHFNPVTQGDFAYMAKTLRPNIPVSEVKKSISLLLRLGFLEENESGGYTVSYKVISSGKKWHSLAILNYQKETLDLAQRFFKEEPRHERDFSTVTITVCDESRKEIEQLTEEYRKNVLKAAINSEDPDQALQLNIQFFPISNKDKK